MHDKIRVVISGGGTGGHIFPAIAIANAIKEIVPDADIRFVGAVGRMEMKRVPDAGYEIVGLPICGFDRKNMLKNVYVLWKASVSIVKARKFVKTFSPHVAVGVGGYASGPLLWAASSMGVPCIIQEQNSYAGVTNKLLSKKVQKICVAYEGMERFFPKDKIVMSGNPIRPSIKASTPEMKAQGCAHFSLSENKMHLLVVGGSLGCGTLNKTMMSWIEKGCPGGENVEVIWQCGKFYEKQVSEFMESHRCPNIHFSAFIDRMDLAYACADLI